MSDKKFDAELYAAALEDVCRYPKEKFLEVVRDVGFGCDMCGRCCTKAYNDHVFLLDEDAEIIRGIDPSALMPSPYFDYSDQFGNFYVVGYSLRTKNDADGSCIFLENNRCTIYDKRPTICRVYPYMIHQEPDEDGIVDWRQISAPGEHGTYENQIDEKSAEEIHEETDRYERKYLEQEIAYRKALKTHFDKNGLRFVQRNHDKLMREYEKGKTGEITVMVYHRGKFVPETYIVGNDG